MKKLNRELVYALILFTIGVSYLFVEHEGAAHSLISSISMLFLCFPLVFKLAQIAVSSRKSKAVQH